MSAAETTTTRCVGTSPFGRTWNFTCSAVERAMPNLAPLLRQAHLFCFPHRPQDVLTKSMQAEQREFWKENFALPYPITAIEDRVGLLIMWDSEYLATEDWMERLAKVCREHSQANLHPIMTPTVPARGMFHRRLFLDVMPTWTIRDGDAFVPTHRSTVLLPREDAVMIQLGVAEPVEMGPDKFLVNGVPLGYWVLSKREIIMRDKGDASPYVSMIHGQLGRSSVAVTNAPLSADRERIEVFRASLNNAKCFMEEVMWFNNPDRFVVEETSETARGKHRKGAIKRADERPVYHSWTPVDVRRCRERGATTESGDPIHRRGHWRRGHFRTLRAERYARSGLSGRTILVRPTFVGEPDFYVARTHYRLLLGKDEVLVGERT